MSNLFGKMTQALEAMDRSVGDHYAGTPENQKARSGNRSPETAQAEDSSTFPSPPPSMPRASSGSHAASGDDVEAMIRTNAETHKEQEKRQQDRDRALLALQRDYDTVSGQVKSLSSQLAQAQDDLHSLSQQRASMRTELAESKDALSRADKELSAANERSAALERSADESQTELENARQEHNMEQAQRKRLEDNLKRLQSELSDHKQKSRMLLMEKDAEIERIRASADDSLGGEHSDSYAAKELETLRSRLAVIEHQKAELETNLRTTTLNLEKARTDAASANGQLESSSAQLQEAKHNALVAQSMYDGEVSSHQATRSRLEGIVKEREEEIRLLEKKATRSAGASTATDTEWERRAKDLGDVVIEKQAALESKRSECDQWRTRYEIAQQKVREMELVAISSNSNNSSSGSHHHTVNIGSPLDHPDGQGDFARSRFFGQLSKRGRWGEHVVGAAQRIDALSLMGGSLLRRSSVMRVAVILYVLTLHVWVFFVLSISSTVPHGSSGSGLAEPKM